MKVTSTKIAKTLIIALVMIGAFQTALRAQQADKPLSVWEGVYTKDQAKRGEALYVQNCSSCHGPDLSGNDEAAPLAGPVFLASWDGLPVGDLPTRVRVSMPPNNLGRLRRKQIEHVPSYV